MPKIANQSVPFPPSLEISLPWLSILPEHGPAVQGCRTAVIPEHSFSAPWEFPQSPKSSVSCIARLPFSSFTSSFFCGADALVLS